MRKIDKVYKSFKTRTGGVSQWCKLKTFNVLLSGITNDSKDPSVDTFKSTALPILKRFGVASEGLDLKIECRGLPPNGGGEVLLSLPVVQSLTVSFWIFLISVSIYFVILYTLPCRQLIGSMRDLLRRLEGLHFQPEFLLSLKIAWLKLRVESSIHYFPMCTFFLIIDQVHRLESMIPFIR